MNTEVETLDLGRQNEWVYCDTLLTRESVFDEADGLKPMEDPTLAHKHYFEGLEVNKDDSALTVAQFPVMHSTGDSVFMTFGQDWAHRAYLFPAFILSASNEAEYALKVRVSAFDQRKEPSLQLWSEWGDCPDDASTEAYDPLETTLGGVNGCSSCDGCGTGQTKTRKRECKCPDSAVDGSAQVCFECEEELEQEEECPYVDCEFSDWTDIGNCVYHSACCETVQVTASVEGAILNGFYGRIYVEQIPFAVYKKRQIEGETYPADDRYIHYHTSKATWVFSDKYWSETNQNVYVFSRDVGYSCPNDMREGSSCISFVKGESVIISDYSRTRL